MASSRTDDVLAVDRTSGKEQWRFVAEGPFRFAPTVWKDRLFAVCDDGYLYCLAADSGNVLWKRRGGPNESKLLGNGRFVSTWPARGAPVVAEEGDGRATVYFSAGIWPFMGIFLYALDAETGAPRWINDGDGSQYLTQPHNADSFAGVAPQGRLVISGDKLLVPGGRSVPAVYDRHTGKMIHYTLAQNAKRGGGWYVQATKSVFVNGTAIFDLENGNYLMANKGVAWVTNDRLHLFSKSTCTEYDLAGAGPLRATVKTKKKTTTTSVWKPRKVRSIDVPGAKIVTRDEDRLIFADTKGVYSLDVPLREGRKPTKLADLGSPPAHLVARDGHVVVSCEDGSVLCLGPTKGEFRVNDLPPMPSGAPREVTDKARSLLARIGDGDGYALLLGVESPAVVLELVRLSRWRFLVVEPDASKVRTLRDALRVARVDDVRASVLTGSVDEIRLPAYCASAVVCDDPKRVGLSLEALSRLLRCVRPYGGFAELALGEDNAERVRKTIASDGDLSSGKIVRTKSGLRWTLSGALPGAADWTHEHADASNSRVSRDSRVKTPLGLLWFGGTSHKGVLPRHGHGPQPQVIEGRAIQEGVNSMRAIDIYTGRLLWETSLEAVGKVFDNTAHQPGANGTGTNFVSTKHGIYVVLGRGCVRLDLDSGKVVQKITLPKLEGEAEPPRWAYLNVVGDYLVGGANREADLPNKKTLYIASSDFLFVLDRSTGKPIWSTRAKNGGYRHNAICCGGDRLYAIDRPPSRYSAWPKKSNKKTTGKSEVLAFALDSGKPLWKAEDKVFGTWLSYSAKHDVLVEAGRVARDSLPDEPKGMRTFRAKTGKVLWYQKGYSGPAMIHGERILQGQGACDLLTGKAVLSPDPITGVPTEWRWARNYGCNTPMASEHLLTFRSGAAGFYDLCNEGGTGNFGGFRSGCTNNLVVAGGILTAPDYTRTCTCSYQNQTSLALVPMPDAEVWTFQGGSKEIRGTVRRLGVLFGAPGNRKADDGTLWLCQPAVRGPGPRPPIALGPEKVTYHRVHSSRVVGEHPWQGVGCVEGLRSLTLTLAKKSKEKRSYRVRLLFVEPGDVGVGQRVFDVSLQGKRVLGGLDIRKVAGSGHTLHEAEFRRIEVGDELQVELTPTAPGRLGPVLSGIEVVLENQ